MALLWILCPTEEDSDAKHWYQIKFWQILELYLAGNLSLCRKWNQLLQSIFCRTLRLSCPSFVVELSLSASFQKQRTDYVTKQPDPVPATPSPPPTPAPVPVAVPLPPSVPAPIPVPVPSVPATISRQSSTSSDSGGSVVRDNQRQKQIPVDRKFV